MSFLNPALLCWGEYQLQTALEEQKLSLVPILLLKWRAHRMTWHVGTCERKKGQRVSDLPREQNICLPQLESLIKSRGSLPISPGSWSSAFLPRTSDWQNGSVVDWPRAWKLGGWELAQYCLGRLMLRQSKCFPSAFWPSHTSPSESGALSWAAFSWIKIFFLPFCKGDHSWWTRLSKGFFCFWGMRKLPSYQMYLHFKLISLQQMASQSMTRF